MTSRILSFQGLLDIVDRWQSLSATGQRDTLQASVNMQFEQVFCTMRHLIPSSEFSQIEPLLQRCKTINSSSDLKGIFQPIFQHVQKAMHASKKTEHETKLDHACLPETSELAQLFADVSQLCSNTDFPGAAQKLMKLSAGVSVPEPLDEVYRKSLAAIKSEVDKDCLLNFVTALSKHKDGELIFNFVHGINSKMVKCIRKLATYVVTKQSDELIAELAIFQMAILRTPCTTTSPTLPAKIADDPDSSKCSEDFVLFAKKAKYWELLFAKILRSNDETTIKKCYSSIPSDVIQAKIADLRKWLVDESDVKVIHGMLRLLTLLLVFAPDSHKYADELEQIATKAHSLGLASILRNLSRFLLPSIKERMAKTLSLLPSQPDTYWQSVKKEIAAGQYKSAVEMIIKLKRITREQFNEMAKLFDPLIVLRDYESVILLAYINPVASIKYLRKIPIEVRRSIINNTIHDNFADEVVHNTKDLQVLRGLVEITMVGEEHDALIFSIAAKYHSMGYKKVAQALFETLSEPEWIELAKKRFGIAQKVDPSEEIFDPFSKSCQTLLNCSFSFLEAVRVKYVVGKLRGGELETPFMPDIGQQLRYSIADLITQLKKVQTSTIDKQKIDSLLKEIRTHCDRFL